MIGFPVGDALLGFSGGAKTKAGKLPALRNPGLNYATYLETVARSVHTPGGWGAEESGMRSGPGHEATIRYFATQLGMWLTEMGPLYELA